jgi:hypothetical protein
MQAERDAKAKAAGLQVELPLVPQSQPKAESALERDINKGIKHTRAKREHKLSEVLYQQERTEKRRAFMYFVTPKVINWDGRKIRLDTIKTLFRDFDFVLVGMSTRDGMALEFEYEHAFDEYNFGWSLSESIMWELAARFECSHANTMVIHSSVKLTRFPA